MKSTTIVIPDHFSFRGTKVYDFESALAVFDWDLHGVEVLIDLTKVSQANYQALSVLSLYIWYLRLSKCRIEVKFSPSSSIRDMWHRMGMFGWSQVLFRDDDFKCHKYKPLIAIRSQDGFKKALAVAEAFAERFDIEYQKTLRYVLSELLYNTLEHGYCFRQGIRKEIRVPSIVQFTWYRKRNELQFVVADIGMGIKSHLENAYPAFESHAAAIRKSLRPNTSGTFGGGNPYASKNNAGVGLYISSNIIRRLNADMYVCSGDAVVHVSPVDTTERNLEHSWPGTLVLISLRLGQIRDLRLQELMQEFRQAAEQEIKAAEGAEKESSLYVNVQNYFGPYAEDKEAAIKYRDSRIVPAIEEGNQLVFDFDGVKAAPHSFLSSLVADPIRRIGIAAYKRIKIVNAEPEIRETLDFILDENTVIPGGK